MGRQNFPAAECIGDWMRGPRCDLLYLKMYGTLSRRSISSSAYSRGEFL